MKLLGRVNEVTNVTAFVEYCSDGDSARLHGLRRPLCNARARICRTDGRVLIETATDRTGNFHLHVVPSSDDQLFLMIGADRDTSASGVEQQEVGCWYRSASFVAAAMDDRPREIDVTRTIIPTASGFNGADLSALLARTKAEEADLEWIRGTIAAASVALECGGKGARASGKLVLKPDMSGDLSKVLAHSIENFRLDLPGPSWLVGLVVSRDNIEASIKGGLQELAAQIEAKLKLSALDAFAGHFGPADRRSASTLTQEATVSFSVLHFSAPGTSQTDHTITAEACLGYPRNLLRHD
ncbi:MAG: hypothetical protein P0120_04555 [Nitrospira sp.]|nr:hypothetical protein [Nitrospira sp.]